MTKHSYDKEFKEQAVQYYLDNKDHMAMNEISKNLGIGASTLHKWIKLFTETGEFRLYEDAPQLSGRDWTYHAFL